MTETDDSGFRPGAVQDRGGRIATSAFFTVAALAAPVGLPLEHVFAYCTDAKTGGPLSA